MVKKKVFKSTSVKVANKQTNKIKKKNSNKSSKIKKGLKLSQKVILNYNLSSYICRIDVKTL
jgi:hypothetical protein